jgi:DNA-binding transcriptional ArsR family regulator
MVNMTKGTGERKIGRLLRILGQPARLRILLAIGEGEACVCHLEAVLGLRQALISQHLMALRRARVLETRRDGRYIYYRLRDPAVLDLVRLSSKVAGVAEATVPPAEPAVRVAGCDCPSCTSKA